MSQSPSCWIIARPNGAGKITWALDNLPDVTGCRRFINTDLIAVGLSPLAPERQQITAGRLFLKEIETHIAAREDFAFETTLSGKGWLRLVKRLIADGWRVELIYLALPDVSMSHMRVAERVLHSGHNIPSAAIERRFSRSLHNLLHVYSLAVSRTRCLMNHLPCPEPVFEQTGDERRILNLENYQLLHSKATP